MHSHFGLQEQDFLAAPLNGVLSSRSSGSMTFSLAAAATSANFQPI
jgi:hypothetical protein